MFYPKPNDMLTCPYEKAHQIERSKMQFHLEKCRRQYPGMKKATCPFDARHVVNIQELDYHISVCDKRGMMDTQRYVVDDGVLFQPTAPAAPQIETEESWDTEEGTSYKPVLKEHHIKKIKGATPSQRRQARCEGTRTYRPKEEPAGDQQPPDTKKHP